MYYSKVVSKKCYQQLGNGQPKINLKKSEKVRVDFRNLWRILTFLDPNCRQNLEVFRLDCVTIVFILSYAATVYYECSKD